MPACLHFAGRIHLHHREVITGWAWSWRGAFQSLADHSKQHTGKGASGIFYISSHLPVAFTERALCSWYFVFLVKEEGKQEKGQMVHGGGVGGGLALENMGEASANESFWFSSTKSNEGECTPSECASKSSTRAAPQTPEPPTRI